MASEQLRKVLEIIKSQPVGGGSGKPTVEGMRSGMEKVAERVASDVKCEPVEAGGVKAEWIVPPGAAEDRVILYLHGGGYVMGSINTHRADDRAHRAGVTGAGVGAGLSFGAGASVSSRG
jgi:hypothetical protein